jgi:hypothetical protein
MLFRHSILERFRQSPEAFYETHIVNDGEPVEPNAAMRIGTAIDALTLTPEQDKIVVLDNKLVRSRDAYKKQATKDKATSDNKVWLTPAEYNHVLNAVESLHSDPEVSNLLALRYEAQKEILWTCPWTGFPKRGTLDYFHPGLVCDLKSTSSWNIQDHRIHDHIVTWGYHRQLAMYREGIEITTGESAEAKIIVVATAPPYEVKIIEVSQQDLEVARQENEQTCNALADWLAYRQYEVY